MKRHHAFDEVMAPLRAYNWQELPPSEQRALFAQLTEILLTMMEHDRLPDNRLRITNADRAQRTGENSDKLALMRAAYDTLFLEMMTDQEIRELLTFLHTAVTGIRFATSDHPIIE